MASKLSIVFWKFGCLLKKIDPVFFDSTDLSMLAVAK